MLAIALVLLLAALSGPVLRGAVAQRLHDLATARGLVASWTTLECRANGVRVDGLVLTDIRGDTTLTVRRASVDVAPLSIALLQPRADVVRIEGARVRLRAGAATADTLAPPEDERHPARAHKDSPERAARVRAAAERVVRLVLAPARRLPRVRLADLLVTAPAEDGPETVLALEHLTLDPSEDGMRLVANGVLGSDSPVPLDVSAAYGHDDRLTGAARLQIADAHGGATDTLVVRVDGRVTQDRRAGVVRLGDATRVYVGALPLQVAGEVSRHGPRFQLRVMADGVDERLVHDSLPPSMLGPLMQVSVRGTFDYRLLFDLDLAHPDSVAFSADVIPHALQLDAARTRLGLLGLDQPFLATIHLPHDRVVLRDLSPANPHFRTLDRIDSLLAHAVVTNEDGGFFRHRGFNTEAVRQSIAENVRAGAYRRGAGTITMQLARNLWLGHARTLSRKMQEVVLAWILEHLTGIGKRRLLEIYLNIIEWGPDVHGADEAAWYYFGHDAGRMTLDESLFLTTIVPAPTKWRYRFDRDGNLREFERAQMHFIARAMVAKGWLDPSLLPPPDSLRVELRGPARDVLFPPTGPGADSTRAAQEAIAPL